MNRARRVVMAKQPADALPIATIATNAAWYIEGRSNRGGKPLQPLHWLRIRWPMTLSDHTVRVTMRMNSHIQQAAVASYLSSVSLANCRSRS